MINNTSAHRVIVIGAGILGVSTAKHLAEAGADVVLVTETAVSSGASGRSLSWLNSAGPRSADYHHLRTLGIDRYRTLAARKPVSSFLRFDGGLTWAKPNRSHTDRHRHELEIGYDSAWLSPEKVATVTPGVNALAIASEGAIFNPGEGWVDLPLLADSLLGDFQNAGGEIRENAGAVSIMTRNHRATGIRTAAGEILGADSVVLATGAAVPRQLSEYGITIPDASPISLLVRTKPVETSLRAVLNTPRVAVRPTPDGSLVLDSGWSEREMSANDDGNHAVNEDTVTELLREASLVLAGNPALTLDSWGAGPKPVPGDGEPVVGSVEGIANLSIIFTHSGATLALILGEFVAREILTQEPNPLLASFRASRFLAPARV